MGTTRRPRRRSRSGPGQSGPRPPPRADGSPRGPSGQKIAELCELSPFSVFCALYLGVTETDGYSDQGRDSVRRRFSMTAEELEAYLREHGQSSRDLERAEFDVESARFDIQVAPPGISRTELARTLFLEFVEGRHAAEQG